MSPTATIAAVVVALLFFGWLFQTDVKDPAYEAYVKRQALEKKEDVTPIRNSLGITVTDAGVTKTSAADLAAARMSNPSFVGTSNALPAAFESDSFPNTPPGDLARQQAPNGGFSSNARLNGTFVGVARVDDVPQTVAPGEEPQITFRRDGSFSTQNMSLAEVDMEAATAAGAATIDRGSGRYRLGANNLELQYTDGMSRKKGNKRTYVIVPVSGPDNAPVVLTIQGKSFKLDPYR